MTIEMLNNIKAKVPIEKDGLLDFYFEVNCLKYDTDATWLKRRGVSDETDGRMDIKVKDMQAYLKNVKHVKIVNIINKFSLNMAQTYASKPAKLAKKEGLHKTSEIETVSYSDMSVTTPTLHPTIHLLIRIKDIVPFLRVIN